MEVDSSAAGPRHRPSEVGDAVGLEPQRTCVGCRTRSPRSDLLRFAGVESEDGYVLQLDPRSRMPGRGAWLHPRPECLEQAIRRHAFVRALRCHGRLDTTRAQAELQDYLAIDRFEWK